MQTNDGVPSTWKVKLKSGNNVLVMADMHEETRHNHLFSLLLDTNEEERSSEFLHITSRIPANPDRVIATIAAFPLDDVVDVEAGDWREIPTE